MELIEIEELEAGDEIIISCQSYFKYLRVINKPVIGKKLIGKQENHCINL
jgi:hypothetical protein